MWALSVVSHSSLSPPRLAFLAWGNFHARSRFARSSILEGKWGQLVVYSKYKCMSAFHDRFCQKTRFEASRVVFWSLSCYKELKLTTNRFTGRTLGGLLIQMQNISLRSSGMRRKQNFETFTFRFLSSPLFSLFLPHFFFSCWAFCRLHFGGKSF